MVPDESEIRKFHVVIKVKGLNNKLLNKRIYLEGPFQTIYLKNIPFTLVF